MLKMVTHITMSIAVSLFTVGLYHFYFVPREPRVVTVNVNQLVDEKIQHLAVSGKSETENKEAIAAFGKKMEQEIKLMAKENYLILLPSAAVLSGAEDVTDTLRKRLAVP